MSSLLVANAIYLLDHVRGVVKHQNELDRVTGEQFNLFQILRIGHYEVSTHSRILGDLLDPNGTHGQGPVFLQLFIKQVQSHFADEDAVGITLFDPDFARVDLEKFIGARTETEGGRLDILLTDRSGNQVAIENKIYAAEQTNWVRRYRNGLQKGTPLIYLTLNGDSAVEDDPKEGEMLILLSYKDDIVAWLEACRKAAVTVPVVRESLTQYLFLIRKLTNQNTGRSMNDKIIQTVLQSSESLDAYAALRDADSSIRGSIVRRLVERLRPHIPDDFELVAEPSGNAAAREVFAFSTKKLKDHHIRAVISFDDPNYYRCFLGFEMTNGQAGTGSSPVLDTLREEFKNFFPSASASGIWPIWLYWAAHPNWDESVLKLIHFGGATFDDEVLDLIKTLRKISLNFAARLDSGPAGELRAEALTDLRRSDCSSIGHDHSGCPKTG